MTKPTALSAEPWLVPVASIVRRWNPLEAWITIPVDPEEVRRAIAEGRLDARPSETVPHDVMEEGFRERRYHIERVAHLVINPDPTPILVEVGCPSLGIHPPLGTFMIDDGNHRLAAAWLRGDATIAVSYSGEFAQFRRVFPAGVLMTEAAGG